MTGTPALTLYARPGCAFCHLVLVVIRRLDMEVDIRNIWQSDESADELVRATGRAVVPVLRIEFESGEVQWMPESRDIIHYLENLAGESRVTDLPENGSGGL